MTPPKAPPAVQLGGFMLLLFLANYGAVQLGFKPFAYCWGLSLAPLFQGYWQIVGVAVLCYFAWVTWRRGILGAIPAGLLVVLVFGAGAFLTTLFGLGAVDRCG